MADGDLLTAVTFGSATGRTCHALGLASETGNRVLKIFSRYNTSWIDLGKSSRAGDVFWLLTDMPQEGWVHDPRRFRGWEGGGDDVEWGG